MTCTDNKRWILNDNVYTYWPSVITNWQICKDERNNNNSLWHTRCFRGFVGAMNRAPLYPDVTDAKSTGGKNAFTRIKIRPPATVTVVRD